VDGLFPGEERGLDQATLKAILGNVNPHDTAKVILETKKGAAFLGGYTTQEIDGRIFVILKGVDV
jgi:hypothetical protein